jgi:hypothetical protein
VLYRFIPLFPTASVALIMGCHINVCIALKVAVSQSLRNPALWDNIYGSYHGNNVLKVFGSYGIIFTNLTTVAMIMLLSDF